MVKSRCARRTTSCSKACSFSKWEKASSKYPIDSENTGYTFVPVKYYEPYVASTPTSCQMKRP